MKLNAWLLCVGVLVLVGAFAYWTGLDQEDDSVPIQVAEPVRDLPDPRIQDRKPLTPNEPPNSQPQLAAKPEGAVPSSMWAPAEPLLKEAKGPESQVGDERAWEETDEERRFRQAEARRIARAQALEAIEAAVIPPGQSESVDLETVLVTRVGGAPPDSAELPQVVDTQQPPPPEILEAMNETAPEELDIEKAFRESQGAAASPELRRYMESGGELEGGQLPPELR